MKSDRKASPTIRQRQWDLRHTAIVETAFGIMDRVGFAALSLDELVVEVGISKPTFYTHFSSKDELGVEVVVQMIRFMQRQFEQFCGTLEPASAVAAIVEWTMVRRMGPSEGFNYTGSSALFERDRVIQTEEEFVDQLARQIALSDQVRANATGAPWLAPRLRARLLLSTLKDPVHRHNVRNGTVELDALVESLSRLLLGTAEVPKVMPSQPHSFSGAINGS